MRRVAEGGHESVTIALQGPQMARPTVLVVDDEIAIAKVLRDFLEAEGFGVLAAHDGAEALALLAHERVDCLLLDIMMPGADGFDVCRQIRATTDVPILFLTAREGDSDKLRGFRLGADDYIVKSATPDEVVARVKAVLRRARPPWHRLWRTTACSTSGGWSSTRGRTKCAWTGRWSRCRRGSSRSCACWPNT